MLENITTYAPTTSSDLMNIPFEVVSKTDCIAYTESVMRQNWIYLIIIIVMGVSFILWNNREILMKKFTPNLYARIQIAKQIDDEEIEKLGAEFIEGMFGGKKRETEIKEENKEDIFDLIKDEDKEDIQKWTKKP